MARRVEAHTTFHRELTESGSSPLAPPTEARTIRIRRGEVLGGYYLIEADSLEAAVEWAQRLRHDADGSIEVRPLLNRGVDFEPRRSS